MALYAARLVRWITSAQQPINRKGKFMLEVNGQVAALEAAVLALISASPNPDEIRELLREVQRKAAWQTPIAREPEYANGWNRTMDMLTTDIPSDD